MYIIYKSSNVKCYQINFPKMAHNIVLNIHENLKLKKSFGFIINQE